MGIIKDYYIFYFIFSLITYLCFKCYKLKNEIISQKEYFINTLGHDFRVSVIAQIRGLDLIQKTYSADTEDYNLIKDINDSCKYTLDMITMLMKIYSLENKDIVLNYECINVNEIIKSVLNDYCTIASDKNISFKYSHTDVHMSADKEYITKIIKILICSAIQHSKRNSAIQINHFIRKNKNILKINYVGQPLTYEEKNRMLSNTANFSTVGYGIQMYLCKKLIDLHKGRLDYISDVNRHNSFEICLP